VEAGATLTIPAGTTIISEKGTDRYIVVQKGGMINVQGTASNPVIMTSQNETPGDWGGLVIAGNGTTTEGIDAVAEVGGIIYGGSDDTDSSGSIEYLVINYAGAQINSESQYNGLSLYAVGSGTTISNLAILNGTDDGVEFFGGTVSITDLYLENNEDDAVDWTEGWSGTITDTFVLHTIAGFSTAIEADGVNANPSIVNFTAVSTKGGTALQFKKESGATITGLSLTGYVTSVEMRDNGPLANVQIDGANADPNETYLADATVAVSSFAWVGSQTGIDTQPLSGSLTTDTTLDANVIYLLQGSLSVESGAKLTIPAGTVIIANAASGQQTETYIVVKKGAQIDIQGTQSNPVVMTSTDQNPGDWGGLILLGDASTTEGVDAIAEVGGFVYGGANDADNSGSIEYLIINYAGAQINAESQYNGLTLYAIGNGTTIQNVAVLNGTDDGVEFFGGTVNATNMYFENNEDDAVDWTEGWNGTLTNAYVTHTVAGFSTALEADGINGNPQLVNFTAISTQGGTALQFKKESGATITNLYLQGYATQVDMRDGGPLANVQIDGAAAVADGDYTTGTQVDVATFAWATGN
jgi:urease beta subunit